MPEVYSSIVDRIDYDVASEELSVVWKKGKLSIYSGVPEDVAQQVMNAPSIGSALYNSIIGVYEHRYG